MYSECNRCYIGIVGLVLADTVVAVEGIVKAPVGNIQDVISPLPLTLGACCNLEFVL